MQGTPGSTDYAVYIRWAVHRMNLRKLPSNFSYSLETRLGSDSKSSITFHGQLTEPKACGCYGDIHRTQSGTKTTNLNHYPHFLLSNAMMRLHFSYIIQRQTHTSQVHGPYVVIPHWVAFTVLPKETTRKKFHQHLWKNETQKKWVAWSVKCASLELLLVATQLTNPWGTLRGFKASWRFVHEWRRLCISWLTNVKW